MKKTKIICTMGPNTNDESLMRKLVQNGMDIARFNFSHGDHEEQKGRMDMLKKIREEENKPIAILLDTKGPEIRTGVLKDGKKVQLEAGETFTLTTDEIVGDNKIVSITYKGLVEDTVFQLMGGLRSGMGYCGTASIEELKEKGRFVKISAASLKESHPHDIHITKEAPNYSVDE